MLEEIKKELLKFCTHDCIVESLHDKRILEGITKEEIIKILDKHDNQPDFKSAWEELKKTVCINELYDSYNDCGGKQTFEEVFDVFKELEQKYNLGGE